MIKTEYRVYNISHTFTRNELRQLIHKKQPIEWGYLIFQNIFEQYTDPRKEQLFCYKKYPQGIGIVIGDLNHSMVWSTTTTGTQLLTFNLKFVQAVETATDKPDWEAYRNVFFESNLTVSEINEIAKW